MEPSEKSADKLSGRPGGVSQPAAPCSASLLEYQLALEAQANSWKPSRAPMTLKPYQSDPAADGRQKGSLAQSCTSEQGLLASQFSHLSLHAGSTHELLPGVVQEELLCVEPSLVCVQDKYRQIFEKQREIRGVSGRQPCPSSTHTSITSAIPEVKAPLEAPQNNDRAERSKVQTLQNGSVLYTPGAPAGDIIPALAVQEPGLRSPNDREIGPLATKFAASQSVIHDSQEMALDAFEKLVQQDSQTETELFDGPEVRQIVDWESVCNSMKRQYQLKRNTILSMLEEAGSMLSASRDVDGALSIILSLRELLSEQ